MGKPEQPKLEKDQEFDQTEIKSETDRRQHVPYILNGELYRIESQIGDNVTVKCCYCPPDRIYRGSVRSTGNFHMHIKRRHAFLLGKLHEMKVAALLERRDRISKNRRITKNRKKSTTPAAVIDFVATGAVSAIEKLPTNTSSETHELKIKTVFQRHKQEHHEQEEATAPRTSVSSCGSLQDSKSESTENLCISFTEHDINNINNNNTAAIYKNNNLLHQKHAQNGECAVTILEDVPILTGQGVGIPLMCNINQIKPEQQQDNMSVEQPVALDLSRTSSMQSDDMEPSVLTHSVQNVQIGIARTQELTAFLNGPPRDILMRIDNSLAGIKNELLERNQIERSRLLFDMAKFKFLHPSFSFDGSG